MGKRRDQNRKEVFTTVLRGFHKEQVSQYLNDLIRKYEREKEELNKKYRGNQPECGSGTAAGK